MVLLHWTKWLPELKQEKPLIGISYSTEAITLIANFSSGELSRAIMALLFSSASHKVFVFFRCLYFQNHSGYLTYIWYGPSLEIGSSYMQPCSWGGARGHPGARGQYLLLLLSRMMLMFKFFVVLDFQKHSRYLPHIYYGLSLEH